MKIPFERIETLTQELARHVGDNTPDGWQFMLHLVQTGPQGFTTYAGNVHREDAIRMHQEWLEHQRDEGKYECTDIEDSCWCCGSKKRLRKFTGKHRTVKLCRECIGRKT